MTGEQGQRPFNVQSPKLTPEQLGIYTKMTSFYSRLESPYLGAICALDQKDYPDKMAHFAHSLLEVIDLLANKGRTKRQNRLQGGLLDAINPNDTAIHIDQDCQLLKSMYESLSRIAHHDEKMDAASAQLTLKLAEGAIKNLLHVHEAIKAGPGE